MSKTAAMKLARRQLAYGHYRPEGAAPYVRCPQCRGAVPGNAFPWSTPSEIHASLQSELVHHLTAECAVEHIVDPWTEGP